MITTIEKLKQGQVFNFPGKTKEYVRGAYIAGSPTTGHPGKYECQAWDDINSFVYKKKGTQVEID